jgi:uncharacterized membrane protein YbhN (UPF0104 family)
MNRPSAARVLQTGRSRAVARTIDVDEGWNAGMSTSVGRWCRVLVGGVIIGLLVWHFGSSPFLGGLRMLSPTPLLAAAAIGLLTTLCAAARWTLVARNLGVPLSLRAAVAAYYRSQFVNSVVPGGVIGDVKRGVQHGRDTGRLGRSLRAVTWDRASGQVIQLLITVIVVSVLASPARRYLPVVVAVVAAAIVATAALVQVSRSRSRTVCKIVGAVRADIRHGLMARRSWRRVGGLSVLVVVGHATTFLVAARAAGVTASVWQLLPLTCVVMTAMSLPTNIAGWGPREGVTAWIFAAAGLGAGRGVATATIYGVMALTATLPGLVLAIGSWRRRRPRAPARSLRATATALAVGGRAHG